MENNNKKYSHDRHRGRCCRDRLQRSPFRRSPLFPGRLLLRYCCSRLDRRCCRGHFHRHSSTKYSTAPSLWKTMARDRGKSFICSSGCYFTDRSYCSIGCCCTYGCCCSISCCCTSHHRLLCRLSLLRRLAATFAAHRAASYLPYWLWRLEILKNKIYWSLRTILISYPICLKFTMRIF